MICSKICPRKLNDCEPVSNIVATIGKDLDFVPYKKLKHLRKWWRKNIHNKVLISATRLNG